MTGKRTSTLGSAVQIGGQARLAVVRKPVLTSVTSLFPDSDTGFLLAFLSLQEYFGPTPSPDSKPNYNVIGLLGEASSGYSVSLVWSCNSALGSPLETAFILSRTPTLPDGLTIESLVAKMTALGANVSSMTATVQAPQCIY